MAESEARESPDSDPGPASAQFRANVGAASPAEASGALQGRAIPAVAVDETDRSAADEELRERTVPPAEARRRAEAEEDAMADATAAPAPLEEPISEKIDSDTNREPLAVPDLAILSIQPDAGVPGSAGCAYPAATSSGRHFGA